MEEVIASLEDKAEQTDYEFEIFGKKLPELKELLMSTLSIELSPTVPSQRRKWTIFVATFVSSLHAWVRSFRCDAWNDA